VDHDGVSVLSKACRHGNPEIVETLMLALADPNLADKEMRTALFNACESGSQSVVNLLLLHPAVDIETASKSGKSPLYIASERGHTEVVRLLLANGANPRRETCRKKIPLYAAAELGSSDLVMELLPYTLQEDLFKLTHFGTTPMHAATTHPNKCVKKLFMAFCKHPEKFREQAKKIVTQRRIISQETDEDVKRKALKNLDLDLVKRINRTRLMERAATPRFVEHLDKFRDHHRAKAIEAYREQERRKLLAQRLQKANNANIIIEEEKDLEESVGGLDNNNRPHTTGSIKKDVLNQQSSFIDMVNNLDKDSVRLHLLSKVPSELPIKPLERISTARRFPDNLEEIVGSFTEKKERVDVHKLNMDTRHQSVEQNRLGKMNVARVVPKIRRMERWPIGKGVVEINGLQEEKTHRDTDNEGGITVKQAQLFQQRQNDRIIEAQKKALARIAAERERTEIEKVNIKRRRQKARIAALRMASKFENTVVRKPFALKSQKTIPENTISSRSESTSEKLDRGRTLRNKSISSNEGSNGNSGGTKTPSLSEYDPLVANLEHDMKDAQNLINDIKSTLKNANTENESLKLPSFADPKQKWKAVKNNYSNGVCVGGDGKETKLTQKKVKIISKSLNLPNIINNSCLTMKMSQKSRSIITEKIISNGDFDKSPKNFGKIKSEKTMNIHVKKSLTLPSSLQSSGETSVTLTPKKHECESNSFGYNAKEYMTGKQKYMTEGCKVNISGNTGISTTISLSQAEHTSPTTSEKCLVSTPLVEVQRLEKLADELVSSCDNTKGFAVRGREFKRNLRSIEKFREQQERARHDRKKVMIKEIFQKRLHNFSKSVSAIENQTSKTLSTRTKRDKKVRKAKQRRTRRRLENAYGVKLNEAKPRNRPSLRPSRSKKGPSIDLDSPSKLFVSGGAMF